MSWKNVYEKWKRWIALLTIALVTVLMVMYYCNVTQKQSVSVVNTHTLNSSDGIDIVYVTSPVGYFETSAVSDDDISDDKFGRTGFDINGSDVMVFLHMQKTGGTTFGRYLVSHLDLVKGCNVLEHRKRRNCLRPNSDTETWLFSRVSTGWRCGLHSDWTELDECVDSKLNEIEKQVKTRKYFEVTMLRYPVNRYVSEYRHVCRGATWKNSRYACNHHDNNIPRCFEGRNWRGASLKDFMTCPYNMAANRQARMLADLRLVNCYERWLNKNLTQEKIASIENAILQSAKENLKKMSFFGLTEEQVKMQALFEYAFPFKFRKDFFQYNETRITGYKIAGEELLAIKRINRLVSLAVISITATSIQGVIHVDTLFLQDMNLYQYAVRLFHSRYKRFIKKT